MSKQYIAIITVADETSFNDLRDADWSGLPPMLAGFRISEATTYTVHRFDRPSGVPVTGKEEQDNG